MARRGVTRGLTSGVEMERNEILRMGLAGLKFWVGQLGGQGSLLCRVLFGVMDGASGTLFILFILNSA